MSTDPETLSGFDPFAAEVIADPAPWYARMRKEQPVFRVPGHGFYIVTRYEDVRAAARDTETFSNRFTSPTLALGRGSEAIQAELASILATGYPRTPTLLTNDPPAHTRFRRLVSRAFTPRRVAKLEDHIRELCAELLAPWDDDADFDYVEDFGGTLPSMVICELLGIPAADRRWVKEKIDTTFHIEPGVGMINDVSLTARIELDRYLLQLMQERADSPGADADDLLSGLAQTELTHREATDFANLLVGAGTETVARLLGWTAVVLDENPDQRAAVAADLSLVPNTVEELLRFESPSPVQGRWSTRDVELHGTVIPKDSKVLLLTGSAGRDERQYPDADRFDVRRRFDQHVSFGYGIHFCLGASLARMEGRVALEETLRRHPEWEVDHANAVRLHTSPVRGWSSVPVR